MELKKRQKKRQQEIQQNMKDILENIISIQKESKKNEKPNPYSKGNVNRPGTKIDESLDQGKTSTQNEKTTPINGGRRDVVGDEVGHIRRYARPCSLCKQGGVIKKNTRKSKKSKKSTRKKKEN